MESIGPSTRVPTRDSSGRHDQASRTSAFEPRTTSDDAVTLMLPLLLFRLHSGLADAATLSLCRVQSASSIKQPLLSLTSSLFRAAGFSNFSNLERVGIWEISNYGIRHIGLLAIVYLKCCSFRRHGVSADLRRSTACSSLDWKRRKASCAQTSTSCSTQS